MPVSVQSSDDGNKVQIKISGRFDFNDHKDFRNAYRDEKSSAEYIVDMSGTEYIDSSALGMLLLLREHAGGDNANIRITNCMDSVMKIFKISNFESMFNLS